MSIVSAHIPYVVGDSKEYIDVKDPEISKAYYGSIEEGEIVHYVIISDTEFLLYANILAPYKEGEIPKVDFTIHDKSEMPHNMLDTVKEDIKWEKWYEEYGRDWYWQSDHEFEQMVPAGEYHVEVQGEGKYSLAIGKTEKFDFWAILRAIINVPRNKLFFFR